MPFIEPTAGFALPRFPEGVAQPTLSPTTTEGETVAAAFRQDNTVVNLFRRMWDESFPPDPNHNPLDLIKDTEYEQNYLSNFVGSSSTGETRQIMKRIDDERADREILAASGASGFIAQIAAGIIDPTIALPGGVLVRGTNLGYSVSRSALTIAAAASAQAALQETVLQGTQETRSAAETAVAVSSAVVLGGIIGGGAAALLSRTERVAIEKLLDADRKAIDLHSAGEPLPASAGAAATDTRQLEMFDVPGLKGRSPLTRVFGSASVEARRVMADLAESPYRFREAEEGVAAVQGPAIDRIARMAINGTRAEIGDNLDRLFADYRFGDAETKMPRLRARMQSITGGDEGKMSYADFKNEVSLAMQNADRHEIPQVAQAASYIRKRLFDPWSERAEKSIEGFKRIEPKEGEAYFPHVWNKQMVKARRPEFVNNLTDLYATDQGTKAAAKERITAFNGALKVAEEQVAKLTAEIATARAGLERVEIRSVEAGAGTRAALDPSVRRRTNTLADQASGREGKIASLEDRLASEIESARRMREKIEAEIAVWEGKSVQEAKSALKTREEADAARTPEAKTAKPRLEGADDAIDRAVKRIIESDRDLSVQELRSRANETADRILGSPDGRLPYDMHMGGPRIGFQGGAPQRGALAGRQLDVSNAWARDFLENDIEQVVALHLRTVIPDVLLSERFGDAEMTQAFRRINESYAQMIDATKAEKDRVRLGKERDAVIRDVAAVRDRVRGVYGWSPDMQNMARVANAAKSVNNMTSMGLSALSSIPDMAGTVFRYGMVSSFRDGWAPFFRGLAGQSEEWGKFKTQMRALGIGVETAINARQHALDDVVDVYRPQSRVERALQGASDKFFIANLLAPLTDTEKLVASHVAVSAIVRASKAAALGTATKKQIANLAESGIDRNMAGRIWQQFETGGEVTDGVHLPNTADWRDRSAADALSGAVAREVDIMVVTPGQEKPLWMSKPVISLLGQFKSFTASATERILVANLQRRDAAALSGVVFSLGLGMLSYKLNSFFGGQKTSDRPADWVKEGISRGGIIGWLEEGNALATKATRGGVDIHRLYGADKPLSRFASRSAADMLLGPTWGKIESIPKITGSAVSGEWSAADTKAVRRLVPLQNLFWLRGLLNQVEGATNAHFGVPPAKEPENRQ